MRKRPNPRDYSNQETFDRDVEQWRNDKDRIIRKRIKLGIVAGVLIILAAIILPLTLFVVSEGHVAVIKVAGKADRQVGPGFHAKIPFVETRETFEVRERKNVEDLAAATANQLPAPSRVSVNWTVNETAAMELFIRYGGLEQFEERVLDPRIRSASKAAISRFRADQIIRERQLVISEIENELRNVTEHLPISISNVQLENVELPETYMNAVLAKEKAREDAAREEHKLAQQKLQAQQAVQSAEAERDSNKALADGNAYRTLTEAKAEAQAIELIQAQLARSPVYVELVKAKSWDGVLPTTVLSEGASYLFSPPRMAAINQ